MDLNTCRHASCSCRVSSSDEFCSDPCRRSSGDAAEHARCDCGHDACARHAARGESRAGEAGRVGYLVLYLMGVPVGVLLLLWVLFGSNLIGPG